MFPRTICLDIGTVRIGVAVSDPLGIFAQGVGVWSPKNWLDMLGPLMEQYSTKRILIGLPIREDGTHGPSAERVKEQAILLAERFPEAQIIWWDERYSTKIATDVLIQSDMSRKKRKDNVDKLAAAIILQNYMDSVSNQ